MPGIRKHKFLCFLVCNFFFFLFSVSFTSLSRVSNVCYSAPSRFCFAGITPAASCHRLFRVKVVRCLLLVVFQWFFHCVILFDCSFRLFYSCVCTCSFVPFYMLFSLSLSGYIFFGFGLFPFHHTFYSYYFSDFVL